MRRFLFAIALLCAISLPGSAQTLTKTELQSNINAQINANGVGGISGTVANSNFSALVSSMATWEGPWSSSAFYLPGEIVSYGGAIWIANTQNNGTAPTTTNSNWLAMYTSTPIQYTVETLPSCSVAGTTEFVTDALSPTYLGTLIGGGSTKTNALCNGATWVSD